MLMAGGSIVAGSDDPHFGIDAVGAVHPSFLFLSAAQTYYRITCEMT
jgi:hypothetical protein